MNDKALPHVAPVVERLKAEWLAPCDVRAPGQLESLFNRVRTEWGGLDFLLHSIAFAPREDLHGRVVDYSAEGFALAMDVSCHSFLRMAKLAEPLMADGGCLLCVAFYGSERVVEHHNLMGPVKATLESATRYVAAELGPQGIRAHAISPGPIATRAASGIARFDSLLERTAASDPPGGRAGRIPRQRCRPTDLGNGHPDRRRIACGGMRKQLVGSPGLKRPELRVCG